MKIESSEEMRNCISTPHSAAAFHEALLVDAHKNGDTQIYRSDIFEFFCLLL